MLHARTQLRPRPSRPSQSKYKQNFREKGWTDPTQLRDLRLEHLEELGIRVPGHKKKLQNALDKLEIPGIADRMEAKQPQAPIFRL